MGEDACQLLRSFFICEGGNMKFETSGYSVKLYGEGDADSLVLIHEVHDEGEQVRELLSEKTREKISFACISGIAWQHELTPWEAPPLFRKGEPFTGGADEYLEILTGKIIPEIQEKMNQQFDHIYIAGYSLAGLFAAYAAISTESFSGFVSASGSMWYPGILEYAESHRIPAKVRRAYFSVGNKEAKSKNILMQTVEENTRKIEKTVSDRNIQTKFELNQGGHFTDENKRLARGIDWIIAGGDI